MKIVDSMNGILNNWKRQYDFFAAISSSFSLDKAFLSFEGCPLCQMDEDMKLVTSEFDAQSIQFILNQNRSIFVEISWPEDEPPCVSSVSFVYHISPEDSYLSENKNK